MFKSKVRPIGIPQYEHARLAAALAQNWGNESFDRPEIDFAKFIEGVALHDWQYGPIDAIPFAEIPEEQWLDLMGTGIDLEFADPTVEVIAKLHMKRLVSNSDSEQSRVIKRRFEERISAVVAQHNLSRDKLEWADAITRFCDSLAFDFAHEAPTKGTVCVYAKTSSPAKTKIIYEIKSQGIVEIDPWPFAASSISGFITGYHLPDFPNKKMAKLIPFHIVSV